MNTQPTTMKLNPGEWRVIVATAMNSLLQNIQSGNIPETPSPEQVNWLHDQLNRLQLQVHAWGASGFTPSHAGDALLEPTQIGWPEKLEAGDANGAAAEASTAKRGWPKGKKRGPRKPRATEAVQ